MSAYFDDLKLLARQLRDRYAITTKGLNLTAVTKIYKAEGITIDRWEVSPRRPRHCGATGRCRAARTPRACHTLLRHIR